MKTGLVLEGGAMRGIYTAGVLDIFNENNIKVDGVIGVSAGSVHGCSYISGQKGRSIRYTMKYRRNPRFMSLRSLIRTGDICEAKFCYDELPHKLDLYDDEAFKKSGIDFYVVCTNVETGMPEYIQIKDMFKQMDAVRASASMPYLSKIVETEGMKLLDGGVSDAVPVKKFMEMGYDRLVVVLTKPRGYQPNPNNVMMSKKLYSKYPDFVDTLITRHLRYKDNLDYVNKLEEEGKILVVRPTEKVKISRTDKNLEHIWTMYQLGRKDCTDKLDSIKEWREIN